MKVRIFNFEKDVKTIKKWWAEWESEIDFNESVLPPLGFVVEDEESLISNCFVYEDSTGKASFLTWVVTNKEVDRSKAAKAINLMFNFAEDEIRNRGYIFIFSVFSHPHLTRLLKKQGFKVVAERASELIKVL